jgi:shikimate kinase
MIVFLTGETGSGKTDTGWALVSALDNLVFLDCDWFASRSPFSWKSRTDVESVYRAIRSQIEFHRAGGRNNFVVTLTLEMAVLYEEQKQLFSGFHLPIHAFRLVADKTEIRKRIAAGGRPQLARETAHSALQREAFDRLFGGGLIFIPVETTGLESGEVAAELLRRLAISD